MSKKATLTRRIVLEILESTRDSGEKLGVFLRNVLNKYDYMEPRDKAFIKYLTEGVVSMRIRLDYVISKYANVKGRIKPIIRDILRMGIYQIMYMDSVPDSAACNESVNLAIDRGQGALKGFVNGVLRNISRDKDNIKWPEDNSVLYSVPQWICERIENDYDKTIATTILSKSLEPSPIIIRLRENLSDSVKEQVLSELEKAGHNPTVHPYLSYAYYIDNVSGMDSVPGFADGYITVQDVSSQLLIELAGIKPGDKIIDMCAAPGGKSIHAADKAGNQGCVDARDLTYNKTDLIEENLERMDVNNVVTHCMDATILDEQSIDTADVVICDVPCSGLGVMGRKSDIKYHVSSEDVTSLAELARAIISNGCQYLKSGGTLMFSTCTILKEENENNRQWIINNLPLEPVSIEEMLPDELKGSTGNDGYMQLLQGVHQCDGFYITKFRKK